MVTIYKFRPGECVSDPSGRVFRIEPASNTYEMIPVEIEDTVTTISISLGEALPQTPMKWKAILANQSFVGGVWRMIFTVSRGGNVVPPVTARWNLVADGTNPIDTKNLVKMDEFPSGSIDIASSDTAADFAIFLDPPKSGYQTFSIRIDVDGSEVTTLGPLTFSELGIEGQESDIPNWSTGVVLSGLEFGLTRPGTYGVDYISPKDEEIQYFLDKGVSFVQLPYVWERVQRSQFSTLIMDEMRRIDHVVDMVTEAGAWCMLDLHNYMRFYGALVGDPALKSSALADLWRKFSFRYKGNKQVCFGLMYSPSVVSASALRDILQEVIATIRDAGSTNWIFVSGTNWSKGTDWINTNAPLTSLQDDHLVYCIVYDELIDTWLLPLTEWAREQRIKLFLLDVPTDKISKIESISTDVWFGAAVLGGGASGWWDTNEHKTLNPDAGRDKKEIDKLQQIIRLKKT